MRTFMIIGLAALLAAALVAGVLSVSQSEPAPRFKPASRAITVANHQNITYNFLSQRPFAGGKVWVSGWTKDRGYNTYLYDLEKKSIRGELEGASPEFMTADGSRLLCSTRARPDANRVFRIMQTAKQILKSLAGRRAPLIRNADMEVFWVIDIPQGRAHRIGSLSQLRGGGSSFIASPGFRRGYNKPSSSLSDGTLFFCDLETLSFQEHAVDGQPCGWWSDAEIVFRDPDGNFLLYNVTSRSTTNLLRSGTVAEALAKAGIDDSSGAAGMFPVWNGKENDFYLTNPHNRWLATNSYLFKLDREKRGLNLISREFAFQWSDHFTPDGQGYVFSGREAGNRSSGVFYRDLRTNTERTLVPADAGKLFSLPNLYKESVIYTRGNRLFQVPLEGTNSTQIFPPLRS